MSPYIAEMHSHKMQPAQLDPSFGKAHFPAAAGTLAVPQRRSTASFQGHLREKGRASEPNLASSQFKGGSRPTTHTVCSIS